MKVLHVITRLAGGSGDNTLMSAVGMDRERYDVWLAGAAGGRLWDVAREAGVRTVPLAHMCEQINPVADARTLVALVRLMRRERFDVVHTHCARAGLLGRLAARLCGVPVVVHTFHALATHDFMSLPRRAAYLFLERAARPYANHYVAVAPRLARQAVASRIARPGATTVIPSAITPVKPVAFPTASSRLRRELGLVGPGPVVGTMGRIVTQKAPLDFVRMAALVQASHPGTHFVMIGDATLESRSLEGDVRKEAARLGVDLVLPGFRADAAELAAGFDVYVVPSLYEGLGRALTEALALGRPVVATAVNGVPDLVHPGATGLLAAPRDPSSLAAGVRWMLDNPTEARAMGAQGQAMIGSCFAPEEMCRNLDGLYGSLLGAPQHVVITLPDDSPTTRREAGQPSAMENAAGSVDPN